MKKIAITGAKGTIGKILSKALSDYKITGLDLPDVDVRDLNQLQRAIANHDALIHLAWDNSEGWHINSPELLERISLDNKLMNFNAYKAAVEAGVPRVIVASSVHADKFYDWQAPHLITPNKTPWPDSPYGAAKVYAEALGRYWASKGLEVVCVRLGGVSNNAYEANEWERAVWLSENDLISLMRKVIDAKYVPDNFQIFYGVSDNKNRIHDYSNPFGWEPKDGI